METKEKPTKRTRNLFTKDEDDVIVRLVKQYPTNLVYAFSEASIQLPGRDSSTITKRWYNHLRKSEDIQAVTVGSSRGYSHNSKNVARKDGVMREQGLRSYMVVVKDLLNLPKSELDLVITFLTGGSK